MISANQFLKKIVMQIYLYTDEVNITIENGEVQVWQKRSLKLRI
jgi:hypothetical protein